MEFRIITPENELWRRTRDYAEKCSWRAGQSLARAMDSNMFGEWERVIVALDNDKISGYCTVAREDCIRDVDYMPYIGYIFVGEEYRGKRVSQRLIECAMEYLKSVGFDRVYIVSDHVNLYEKYGFHVVDCKIAPWGAEEKIYMQVFQ